MPLFEYKCSKCSLLDERLVYPPEKPLPEVPCARCGAPAHRMEFPSRISLSRSSMDNAPVDSLVGRDAEARWNDIRRRQEIRDGVRRETGEVGLSMNGRNAFQPLTSTQKELRTSLSEAVASAGGYTNPELVPGS